MGIFFGGRKYDIFEGYIEVKSSKTMPLNVLFLGIIKEYINTKKVF